MDKCSLRWTNRFGFLVRSRPSRFSVRFWAPWANNTNLSWLLRDEKTLRTRFSLDSSKWIASTLEQIDKGMPHEQALSSPVRVTSDPYLENDSGPDCVRLNAKICSFSLYFLAQTRSSRQHATCMLWMGLTPIREYRRRDWMTDERESKIRTRHTGSHRAFPAQSRSTDQHLHSADFPLRTPK